MTNANGTMHHFRALININEGEIELDIEMMSKSLEFFVEQKISRSKKIAIDREKTEEHKATDAPNVFRYKFPVELDEDPRLVLLGAKPKRKVVGRAVVITPQALIRAEDRLKATETVPAI